MSESIISKRKKLVEVFEQVSQRSKRSKHFFDGGTAYSNKFNEVPSSECDLVIDDDEDETQQHEQYKRKFIGVRLIDEPIKIICSWDDCTEFFSDFDLFLKHVDGHSFDQPDENDIYNCKFINCTYFASFETLKKHMAFHAYHIRLKNIGENVLERVKLPKCHQQLIELPHIMTNYLCEWRECDFGFSEINGFLMHMKIHVNSNPKVCKKHEIIKCGWNNCTSTFKTQYKLADHLRSHSKEKVIACPTCGNMFAAKTKFNDHRKRQLAVELQSYQCSQCNKLFPSERLLRDHMRAHINHYKCTMCDMTCTKPSVLARHIRFRHLNERQFKCNLCNHSSISKTNLEQHLTTHCPDKLMACEECNFRCRSLYGLDRHYQIEHGQGNITNYECHCCQKRFNRGGNLTTHLLKVHDFHWPSGHSRFKYKEDTDGIFRLQTVRYESLEVTQEMMNNTKQPDVTDHIKYNLEKQSENAGKAASFVVVSENGEENVVRRSENNIIIRLDDVDSHGNIVKSQMMEAKEMVSANTEDSMKSEIGSKLIEELEECIPEDSPCLRSLRSRIK